MEKQEVWIDVEGTDGQYQIGSLGHMRLMYRKTRPRKRSPNPPPTFVGERRRVLSAFEDGRIGWSVRMRNGDPEHPWRFIPRDEAMAVFEAAGVPVCVDTSGDEEAFALRERKLAEFAAAEGSRPS